jgi:hypothetical protein
MDVDCQIRKLADILPLLLRATRTPRISSSSHSRQTLDAGSPTSSSSPPTYSQRHIRQRAHSQADEYNNIVTPSTMRPNSPRTAQYERLEDGMLGVPARAVRRIGWQRLLFGAAVVMCFLYVVSPSAPVQRVGGMGRPDPLDPLTPVSTTHRSP